MSLSYIILRLLCLFLQVSLGFILLWVLNQSIHPSSVKLILFLIRVVGVLEYVPTSQGLLVFLQSQD